jgi:hypothetical protein
MLRIMAEPSVIVWDLETVPDLSAAARMLDLGHAPETQVREALGSGFPKHPLHKIACIGALIASRQPEGWRLDALGAPHIGERSANPHLGEAVGMAKEQDELPFGPS